MGAAVKTQRILANLTGVVLQKYMAQPQSLTGLTPQILAVENLKPAAGGYALVCTVRMPGGAEARQSYFVSAGMEDADELLHELEKLRSLESRLEPRDTRHTGALVVSAAAALLLGAVCAASHPAVGLRYIARVEELGRPDLVILPGTKSTLHDLRWLRQSGLEAAIQKLAAGGTPVIGICGGYQMLGESLSDPEGAEGGGQMAGMGLLPVSTVFRRDKTRTQTSGNFPDCQGFFAPLSGTPLEGYEDRKSVV